MSADNFLVVREREDGRWEVRMAFMSGWDLAENESNAAVDEYLQKYTSNTEDELQVFDTEDQAQDYVDDYEATEVVEYGRLCLARQ